MDRLTEILDSHFGANKHPIKLLKSSCCPSDFEVIDFDAVKDNFCTEFLIPEHAKLSSADGLHIDEQKKIICFIEMKDINSFLVATLPKFTDFKEFKKEFDLWLDNKNRNLRLKMADSLFITIAALSKYSSDPTSINELLNKGSVKIKYVALLNVSSSDYTKYKLASLSQRLSYGMLAGPQCIPVVIRAVGFDNYVKEELE